MYVQQFFVKGLAHLSYILGGNQTCAVIDPKRDVDGYIKVAKDMGLKITHIIETHLHADFISGHLDLKELTGAKIYAPKAANCQFDHVSVEEGDILEIEDVELKVLETPGHTPEHVSYAVSDRSRGEEPVAVFCGDSLFVGDVGRPDLFPDMAEELTSKLHDSLHQKILNSLISVKSTLLTEPVPFAEEQLEPSDPAPSVMKGAIIMLSSIRIRKNLRNHF